MRIIYNFAAAKRKNEKMTTINLSPKRWLAILITIVMTFATATAQENANTRQARQIFDRTYNMVFGPQGCSLSYAVNIIGLYKTEGNIWYKGKKQKFIEKRFSAWCDGKDLYRADRKKKTIERHNPNSPNRDKYASKFKFVPDNYTYHITASGNDFIITLDAKKGVDGVKHAKCVIDKVTRVPKSLKVKVMFFWASIKISNFHSGIINESIFTFPHQQFSNYKMIDKRQE